MPDCRNEGAEVLIVPNNFLQYLSMHNDCSAQLFAKASNMTHAEVDCSPNPDAKKIRRMVNDVANELFLMRGFVRLKPLGISVLHGYMKPEHDIGFSVGHRLAKRNPETIIVLGNSRESWITFFDGKKVHYSAAGPVGQTVEKLGDMLNTKDEGDFEELWKEYFWSQYCDERRNIRYYRSNMPRKYLKRAGLKVASNTNRTTLDDFTAADVNAVGDAALAGDGEVQPEGE